VRLHEKGGKLHTLACHHNLDRYLEEYTAAACIAQDAKGPLFRTARDRSGKVLTGNALWQQDAYRMIQRRAAAAGIKTHIGNHSFRATGMTAFGLRPRNLFFVLARKPKIQFVVLFRAFSVCRKVEIPEGNKPKWTFSS
jgi:hypothetical protein